MEQQYEWAVEVTTEYLDRDGAVEQAHVEARMVTTEEDARARHKAIQDTMARYGRTGHSRYQRLAGSKLLRRPVGDWETVQA